MTGIVLAGGLGTRLAPLTLAANKHLLPVYDRPMVYFPIGTLVEAGIRRVVVVTGREDVENFRRVLLGAPPEGVEYWDVVPQDGAGGIADALLRAEGRVDGPVCVILGDNMLLGSIRPMVESFARQGGGARLLLKHVADPRRFGVARFAGAGPGPGQHPPLVGIDEKPADPPSAFAVMGVYCYDPAVFSMCRKLRPSARGELEITDLNNAYIAQGKAEYDVFEHEWIDAGTVESLHRAACTVASQRP